jgi:glycosyltransferase involved in cell wall biosynthesis
MVPPERKVPTVFWNKEDPVHFETFLNTAQMFDYVFTTDIDCIHRYKAALGHDRVYLLPFACQPATTNPLETFERKDAFCFAGAYYVRYPERTRDLGNFVSTLAAYRPVEIYDRNYGKSDPNYQFPAEYKPFIVGNLPFDQIDKAYKGYRYAINLNSIKQSQSMFARRVFDLLASNTITVSNFSRGVRLFFGDLAVTTDNGDEVVKRLEALGKDDIAARKFRLAGLRKVMREHTYQDRFAYVVAKLQGGALPNLLPLIAVTAYVKNQEQLRALLENFGRQDYVHKRLLLVVPKGFTAESMPNDESIQVLAAGKIDNMTIGDLMEGAGFIAGMVPDDYYGPNYLLDLALATRYSNAEAIGKVTHHVWSPTSGLSINSHGAQYRLAAGVPARSALAARSLVEALPLRDWVTGLYTRQLEAAEVLAVDEFNYCKNGNSAEFLSTHVESVNDLIVLDTGIVLAELIHRSERITPLESGKDEAPVLTGDMLAAYFKPAANKGYKFSVAGTAWEVESSLADEKHDYLYSVTDLLPAELGYSGLAQFYLDVTPGLNLQIAVIFLDAQKQRISHVVKAANRNQEAEIPAGTVWMRLGLRLCGAGSARINALVLGQRALRPAEVIGRAEHLVLTNHYPSYDDLYRNTFVHSRVSAYGERGTRVDVFRLRSSEPLSYHEFHNVDVISGSQEALHKLLLGGSYKSVLVHFLDESMWQVLQQHIDRIKVFVWVHGAEIQPWHRRDYNYETDQHRDAAKLQSEARMAFWRGLLREMPKNMKLIFVSNYFAEEVMEDLGFRLPETLYTIIHNPIDTELFTYQGKLPEQRKKILSIRPYANRKYANDLSVSAILELAKKPFFKDMNFRMIGDGLLFDETLAPLRSFENVHIERRFLTHNEIAALHREYGIFLCPTRMDAQGVSRDEAMSSGLVPVTNNVAAIPEFVDGNCGVLAEAEDADGLAAGIAALYEQPEKFLAISKAAAERVRSQSDVKQIILKELELFTTQSDHALQSTIHLTPYQVITQKQLKNIVVDFRPYNSDITVNNGITLVPLLTGEMMEISADGSVDWMKQFDHQHRSSVLHLYSLEAVGRLLITYCRENNVDKLRLARMILRDFLRFCSTPEFLELVDKCPSADHSAATRVNVLIIYINIENSILDNDVTLLRDATNWLFYWSEWISDPNNVTTGNHALMQSLALLNAGIFYNNLNQVSDIYINLACQRTKYLIDVSFDMDGLCNENTIGYHLFNVRLYEKFVDTLLSNNITSNYLSEIENSLVKARQAFLYCIRQDGTIPPIGDSPVYKVNFEPINESYCFTESGFAVIKNNDLYLSLVCGSRTEIHKHVDDTSITLRYNGCDLIIDGGSYLYDRLDRHRICLESSRGHSGIFLAQFDDLLRSDYVRKAGQLNARIINFSESDVAAELECISTLCDGNFKLHRKIKVFFPDEIIIHDSISGDGVSSQTIARQRFILAPGVTSVQLTNNSWKLNCSAVDATIFQLTPCNYEHYNGEYGDIVRGWHSVQYKEILPTEGIDFVQREVDGLQFLTVIKLSNVTDLSELTKASIKYLDNIIKPTAITTNQLLKSFHD